MAEKKIQDGHQKLKMAARKVGFRHYLLISFQADCVKPSPIENFMKPIFSYRSICKGNYLCCLSRKKCGPTQVYSLEKSYGAFFD